MGRQIRISASGLDVTTTATLSDNGNAVEYADRLWDELASPLKMWTVHTVSTGDWVLARARPSAKAQALGTQADPLAGAEMMCDIDPGAVVYSGHQQYGLGYGPDVTEPLLTHGPVVARADDLDAFHRIGSHVCDSHFKTHELVTVTVSREEN
jgi:hypothetical protein